MFRNRISVVRRAKNASKPSSIHSSLSSTTEEGAKGDGPSASSSLPVGLGLEHPCGFSRASEMVTPSSSRAADESSVMEISKPDEGICIDETACPWVDSGEIAENELRVTVDDNNLDVTKDLDLSRPSPSLFSVTTPKRARMLLEMQKQSDEGRETMVVVPASSSTPSLPTVERTVSLRTTQSEVSPAMFRCNVDETPILQQQQQNLQVHPTPWSSRSLDSQLSKQTGDSKRQTIAGAIDDLNEMTEELIDFIKGFEKKYSNTIH